MNSGTTEQPGAATEAASNDDRSQLLADLATEDRGAAQASSVIPEDAEHAASGAEDGVVAEEGQSDDGVVDPKAVDSKAEDAKTKEREEKALRRADDEWKKIQAEKETLRREREAVEAAKREAAGPKYKPEDYERLAETYKAEGRDDLAKAALDEAGRVRTEEQSNRSKAATDSLTRAIQANFAKACETDPDLQVPESDLYKRVDAVLKARPVFFTYPEGVLDVIGSVKAGLKSERVASLESELASVKQKLIEAEKKLQPSGSGLPVTGRGSDNTNEIPLSKMRARLLAELRGEDARA